MSGDMDFPTARALLEVHGWLKELSAWGTLPEGDPHRAVYDRMLRMHDRLMMVFIEPNAAQGG